MAETRYDVVIAGGGFVGRTLRALRSRAWAAPRASRRPDRCRAAREAKRLDAMRLGAVGGEQGLACRARSLAGACPRRQAIETIEITDSALDAVRVRISSASTTNSSRKAALHGRERRPYPRARRAVAEPAIDALARRFVTGFEATPFAIKRCSRAAAARSQRSLLVAADGKRSRLRERAGIKCVGWSYPQVGIVTTVAHEQPHHGKAVQHFLPSVPSPFCRSPATAPRSCGPRTDDRRGDHGGGRRPLP